MDSEAFQAAEKEAQNLFLELLRTEADIDGKIINVTGFLNFQYLLSHMKTLAQPFVERYRTRKPDFVLTAPSSGMPFAHQVAVGLDVNQVIFPRKGATKPKNLVHYRVCERHVGSPTGGAENLYFRWDKMELLKGKTGLFADDFLFTGNTGNAILDEMKEHEIELVGMAFLFDKGMGGYESLKARTNADIYSLMKLSSIRDPIHEGYAILDFVHPRASISIRKQRAAVTTLYMT